jgi:hypothetical protein
MTLPSWFTRLLPKRNQTFGARFIRLLITYGCAFIVWETVSSGVLRSPENLPYFLLFEIPFALIGVLVFAALEHLYFRGPKEQR